jgi:uncharacterized Fe-S cluster-containing radical SAM superfamily enzyme
MSPKLSTVKTVLLYFHLIYLLEHLKWLKHVTTVSLQTFKYSALMSVYTYSIR